VILLALVPLVVGAVAAITARRAGDRLAPALATVLLTGLALTVALATGLVLCLAAFVGASEVLPAPVFRHWSVDELRDTIPMPPAAGLAAGAVAALLIVSAVLHLSRVVIRARRTSAAAAAVPAHSDLAVVRDDAVFAYAVPGRHRRIVASTGMLTSLSGPQRRALLAHEEAHLRYHHHVFVQLGRLAAAANPLMRPVSRAVDGCVERWADTVAARVVGDRVTVARAVAAAALAPARVRMPDGSLAAARSNVVDRVRVLLDPPARRRPVGIALVAGVVVCWVSAAAVLLHVHALIEIAQAVGAR
jgi:hypothetical protein